MAFVPLVIIFVVATTVGAISNGDSGLNATELPIVPTYTYTMKYRSDARRDPDRVPFSVIITDTTNDTEYPVGVSPGDEILAFKRSQGGSAYAFVQDDHVYYVSSPEVAPIRVSKEESELIHGRFDWIYTEEIFGRDQAQQGALWFSPSDKYLAFASRAANSSKKAMMSTFSREYKYDFNYDMEYPKTRENISQFSVSIWNNETNKSITMDVQYRDHRAFHYLFGVSWVVLHGEEILVATWANRWQNETTVTLCSYEMATCIPIYEHKYEPAQWASPEDYANLVHSNSSIFFLLPEAREDNAWQHILKLEITMNFRFSSISFLPSGDYDISQIIAYIVEENIVVFEAQAPLPWNMHIYGTPAGAQSLLTEDQCLTCVLSNCTYQYFQEMRFSAGAELISFACYGPSQPYGAAITLNSSTLELLQIITIPSENPEEIRKWKIETFLLPSGYEANIKIYEGNSELSSVPVILHVYGGPSFNQVTDEYPKPIEWPIGYGDHAIVHIDVRGSGGRGWKYRSAIYGRLVTVEVEDTLEAMKMVLEKYPRLDKNRVAVDGWSYGGTLTTALVELAPTSFFKCAAVGAPVTDFLYYDATYTERFMGDAPPSAYVDLTLDVSKFMNTSLLLVHGLRDDNVHFQHSALLIESLQQANIPFELMVYPNEDHGISNARMHVMKLQESFFNTCFQ